MKLARITKIVNTDSSLEKQNLENCPIEIFLQQKLVGKIG